MQTKDSEDSNGRGIFLETCRRIEGLVNYIAGKYVHAAEIGIGHSPDVAFALMKKGIRVFATDVRPFQYNGLKVVMDDITVPAISVYTDIDILYSLRPPPELVPYMVRLARTLSSDLIVKSLASEYPDGQLINHGNTTFFLWNYHEKG
jgi:uncharacterized UPF0146 family protein